MAAKITGPCAVSRFSRPSALTHTNRRAIGRIQVSRLIRRTHLFYQARGQAVTATAVVADLMGPLLGWDEARRAEEIELYLKEVEASRRFLKE